MASTESEIRTLFDTQCEAIRTKDLDRLMSFYSPDVVYFDVVPPLRYAGSAALRERFQHWFNGFKGSVDIDVRDVSMVASGEIANAHWLSRVRGTLQNGRAVGSWVRATNCWRRSNHTWLITHEHISLPVDMTTGTGAMNLVPGE